MHIQNQMLGWINLLNRSQSPHMISLCKGQLKTQADEPIILPIFSFFTECHFSFI